MMKKSITIITFLSIAFSSEGQNKKKDSVYLSQEKYDTSFNIVQRVDFPKNLKNGIWNTYYVTGKLRSEFQVVDGFIQGDVTFFWPNGNVMYKGFYKYGFPYNNWNYYNRKGVINKIYYYKKGKFRNKLEIFNEEGLLINIVYFEKDGKTEKKLKIIKR